MENMDLFQFKFVDRVIEREVVNKFLLSSNSDSVLWIHGESGVGKTELIKYFEKNFLNRIFIHINPIKTQNSSYFSLLAKALDKETLSLPNFILKNYKKVRDLTKDSVSEINLKTKFLTGILEIGEKLFIDANDDFFSTASVLTQYIKNISKNQHYIFVFDNFQQCDIDSLEIIQDIIKNLLDVNNVKFVFITTDNTISSSSEGKRPTMSTSLVFSTSEIITLKN